MNPSRKFKNTDRFRQPALKFLRDGVYCEAPVGTKDWEDFWNTQKERSLNGFESEGVRITGQHYFYLNFCPILAVTESDGKSATKSETFPKFWDGDYNYFWSLEIAKNGISEEKLENLKLGFDPLDIEGGNHMVVLKARGKGFSYKAGSMLTRNFCLKRKSKNYAMAYDKQYLKKDGLLTKAWDTIDHIDEHTPYRQPKLIDQQMHKRSGYRKNKGGTDIEMGTKNDIIGVSLKDNPDKARGKRGDLIFFEEAGKFPGLKSAWEICRSNVEQGSHTIGTMIAYGTGGTEQGDYESLEELFYNPTSYNILPIKNQWEDETQGRDCAFFFPAYVNWEGHIDDEGNSQIESAKQYLKEQQKKKKKADDPNALEQFSSENPFTPQDAVLRISKNILPTHDLKQHLGSVQGNERYSALSTGRLYRDSEGKVKFTPDPDSKPLFKYPTPKNIDRRGAVVIKESPVKDEHGEPHDIYAIGHDPYAHDGSPENASLGATYVFKKTNQFSLTYNECIVASYVGRPSTTDEYNRVLFMLAEYYGCKIGFENNRGDVIGYAKRFNKLDLLEREFDVLSKKKTSQKRRTSRPYGITMTKQRKKDAQLYLKDWLLSAVSRYTNEDTLEQTQKLVMHTILDPAFLQELIKYDPNKKTEFDRVSAAMIGMYYLKDMEARNVNSGGGMNKHKEFFDRNWFQ